jgi:hypothetical protein
VLVRFYDPRILPTFLASDIVSQSGFWDGMIAYGVGQEAGVKCIRPPEGISTSRQRTPGLVISADLLSSFARLQKQDFIRRCSAYLKDLGIALPSDEETFFRSFFHYAFETGIDTETDLVRFLHLVLGWKEMRTITSVREVLKYPGLSGKDKVDLLCEMVAFGEPEETGTDVNALDAKARYEADKQFLEEHRQDRQFMELHPDGSLTLNPRDARWRKEWLRIYTAEVVKRAKVSDVILGSVQV